MLSAVRGCGAGSQARGRFQYGSAVAIVVALAIALAQDLMTLSAQSSRRQTADRVCMPKVERLTGSRSEGIVTAVELLS
jgi:hypothetical protein